MRGLRSTLNAVEGLHYFLAVIINKLKMKKATKSGKKTKSPTKNKNADLSYSDVHGSPPQQGKSSESSPPQKTKIKVTIH